MGDVVRIKICGITSVEDALAAVECGADAVGFVFSVGPRQVQPDTVKRIVAELPPLVTKVGVFQDWSLDRVRETMRTCGLDLAQLRGQESPEYCRALYPRVLKAFVARQEWDLLQLPNYRAAGYLMERVQAVDGQLASEHHGWRLARKAGRYGPVLLGGQLTIDNVAEAVVAAQPYGVDVSAGVESRPGHKDRGKLVAFVDAVRFGHGAVPALARAAVSH